jgi:hypothetical protein
MSLKLIGRHAVDVGGGNTVEPGEEIPDTADPEIVEMLLASEQAYDEAETEPEAKKKGS